MTKNSMLPIQLFMNQFSELIASKVHEKLNETELSSVKVIDLEFNSNKKNDTDDELLTIKEVCEMLKIKRGTLNSWRIKGLLIPDTYVGRSPRYKKSTIQNYINNIKNTY